ncbi:MAG: carbohydrate porin [Cytophagaceae bacterium]|jgi:maltoporin|nr:carbohydrate porin [Cytophagaceae bacterium]
MTYRLFLLLFLCWNTFSYAQNKVGSYFSLSSYGRLGISTSLRNEQYGVRLNLLNQGSIGGRHEENDYIEVAGTAHISQLMQLPRTAPNIQLILRWQFFSGSNTLIFSNTQSVLGEAYILVDSIATKKQRYFSLWMGQRYYRYHYSPITDYFYFNNSTAQGVGIAFTKLKVALLTVVPQNTPGSPYGDILAPDFQRIMANIQYRIPLANRSYLDVLGEVHSHVLKIIDSIGFTYTPPDIGWVIGALWYTPMSERHSNSISLRYGAGIANGPGDDNWSSRTYVTYGNPNDKGLYAGAYGINIVDQWKYKATDKYEVEAYAIYRYAQGAAKPTYLESFTRENKKQDVSLGLRHTYFISDRVHLLSEVHWQTRQYVTALDSVGQDKALGWAQMTKVSIIPTFVPTGKRDAAARPHIRLVYSIAFYDTTARTYQLSDYLRSHPDKKVGMYLGIKTEWDF